MAVWKLQAHKTFKRKWIISFTFFFDLIMKQINKNIIQV